MRSVVIGFVVFGLAACKSGPPLIYKDRYSRSVDAVLDGDWFGHLEIRKPYTSASPVIKKIDKAPLVLTVSIRAKSVRVFMYQDGDWSEAMRGKWVLVRRGPTAVAYATNSSDSNKSGWVETWTLTMTASHDKVLATEWSRVVNNLNANPSQSLPTFTMAAMGNLEKVVRE